MIRRLISGGQTGVDRAALDAAIELGIDHGGWCPRGRRAEDGRIDDHYQLNETNSANYAVRTEQNVIDSDATLILYRKPLSGGTKLTKRLAEKHQRDVLLVDMGDGVAAAAEQVTRWLNKVTPKILNVAGPRASTHANAYDEARAVLMKTLTR